MDASSCCGVPEDKLQVSFISIDEQSLALLSVIIGMVFVGSRSGDCKHQATLESDGSIMPRGTVTTMKVPRGDRRRRRRKREVCCHFSVLVVMQFAVSLWLLSVMFPASNLLTIQASEAFKKVVVVQDEEYLLSSHATTVKPATMMRAARQLLDNQQETPMTTKSVEASNKTATNQNSIRERRSRGKISEPTNVQLVEQQVGLEESTDYLMEDGPQNGPELALASRSLLRPASVELGSIALNGGDMTAKCSRGQRGHQDELEPMSESELQTTRQLANYYHFEPPVWTNEKGEQRQFGDDDKIGADSKNRQDLPGPTNVSVLIISWYPPILRLTWNLDELSKADLEKLNFYQNLSGISSGKNYSSSNEFDFELALSSPRENDTDEDDDDEKQLQEQPTNHLDEIRKRRLILQKSLTCFQVTYNIVNSRFKVTEEYPAYLRSILLERLIPATEYSLRVVAVYLGGRIVKTSERVQFVSPTDNESRRFKENTYRPIHRYPDVKSELRVGLAHVRGEELFIVGIAVTFWIATICLFFNKWGKIRMLEPYQPAYREASPSATFVAAGGHQQHQPSLHQLSLVGVPGSIAPGAISPSAGSGTLVAHHTKTAAELASFDNPSASSSASGGTAGAVVSNATQCAPTGTSPSSSSKLKHQQSQEVRTARARESFSLVAADDRVAPVAPNIESQLNYLCQTKALALAKASKAWSRQRIRQDQYRLRLVAAATEGADLRLRSRSVMSTNWRAIRAFSQCTQPQPANSLGCGDSAGVRRTIPGQTKAHRSLETEPSSAESGAAVAALTPAPNQRRAPENFSHKQRSLDLAAAAGPRGAAQKKETPASNRTRRLLFMSKTHQHLHMATSTSLSQLLAGNTTSTGPEVEPKVVESTDFAPQIKLGSGRSRLFDESPATSTEHHILIEPPSPPTRSPTTGPVVARQQQQRQSLTADAARCIVVGSSQDGDSESPKPIGEEHWQEDGDSSSGDGGEFCCGATGRRQPEICLQEAPSDKDDAMSQDLPSESLQDSEEENEEFIRGNGAGGELQRRRANQDAFTRLAQYQAQSVASRRRLMQQRNQRLAHSTQCSSNQSTFGTRSSFNLGNSTASQQQQLVHHRSFGSAFFNQGVFEQAWPSSQDERHHCRLQQHGQHLGDATLGAPNRPRISSVFVASPYNRAHRDSFAMLRALSQKKSKSAEDVACLSSLVLQIWVRDRNPLLQSVSQQQLIPSRSDSQQHKRHKSSTNVNQL